MGGKGGKGRGRGDDRKGSGNGGSWNGMCQERDFEDFRSQMEYFEFKKVKTSEDKEAAELRTMCRFGLLLNPQASANYQAVLQATSSSSSVRNNSLFPERSYNNQLNNLFSASAMVPGTNNLAGAGAVGLNNAGNVGSGDLVSKDWVNAKIKEENEKLRAEMAADLEKAKTEVRVDLQRIENKSDQGFKNLELLLLQSMSNNHPSNAAPPTGVDNNVNNNPNNINNNNPNNVNNNNPNNVNNIGGANIVNNNGGANVVNNNGAPVANNNVVPPAPGSIEAALALPVNQDVDQQKRDAIIKIHANCLADHQKTPFVEMLSGRQNGESLDDTVKAAFPKTVINHWVQRILNQKEAQVRNNLIQLGGGTIDARKPHQWLLQFCWDNA